MLLAMIVLATIYAHGYKGGSGAAERRALRIVGWTIRSVRGGGRRVCDVEHWARVGNCDGAGQVIWLGDHGDDDWTCL